MPSAAQLKRRCAQIREAARCTRFIAVAGSLATFAILTTARADDVTSRAQRAAESRPQTLCLPSGDGFLRARLDGSLNIELDWKNAEIQCSGSVRPDGGLRLRFKREAALGDAALVLLFGIPGLKEGAAGKALPVNVTVIREGSGEFYGTQGDNKCTIDDITQTPLAGIPLRNRSYRVVARGFCTQPARAVKGAGHILISRFDFAGRVDFSSDDEPSDLDI